MRWYFPLAALLLLISPANAHLLGAGQNRVWDVREGFVEPPLPMTRLGSMSRSSFLRPYDLDVGRAVTLTGKLYCPLYAASCVLIDEGAVYYVPADKHVNVRLGSVPAAQRDYLTRACSQVYDACRVVLTGKVAPGINKPNIVANVVMVEQ